MSTKWTRMLSWAALAALMIAAPAVPAHGAAPPPAPGGPATFDTPQAAADALVAACEKDDPAALLALFGPQAKDLIESGDAVADRQQRQHFLEKARQRLQVSFPLGNPREATLLVGSDGWPFPAPIVQEGGRWLFDSAAGRDEVLARRIGENELDAIALLRGFVEAQFEYAGEAHDDSGMLQYAQRTLSTKGKRDGLSWWNEDGSPGGPMGEVVAQALAAGYTDKTKPYNGYFFRVLTGQGPHAPLGARSYVVNGAMIGGFAMIAWPANYGVTGIQTFQVNHDGLVYQKDLGPETETLAPALTVYDPGPGWIVTLDEP